MPHILSYNLFIVNRMPDCYVADNILLDHDTILRSIQDIEDRFRYPD